MGCERQGGGGGGGGGAMSAFDSNKRGGGPRGWEVGNHFTGGERLSKCAGGDEYCTQKDPGGGEVFEIGVTRTDEGGGGGSFMDIEGVGKNELGNIGGGGGGGGGPF